MHTDMHVDAPLHFDSNGEDVAFLSFDRLIRPGYVVDLTDIPTPWHVFTPAEIEERLPGPLEAGDALMLRYGWRRSGVATPRRITRCTSLVTPGRGWPWPSG